MSMKKLVFTHVQTRPAVALSTVLVILLCALQGCSDAKGIADEHAAAKEAEKTVLVYTDNTPGIRVTAFAMHRALRSRGHASVVTTDEAEFIRLLPTRRWSSVLVTTRFETTRPAYLTPLRTYMQTTDGGWAQIYTWLDDPNAPARPGSIVIAPMAMNLWMHEFTTRTYMTCRNAAKPETVNDAYVLSDFKGVEPEPLFYHEESVCVPLTPGAYGPIVEL